MGLLTLTCQMARRQEAAGVGGGAIGGWSWVAGACRSGHIYVTFIKSGSCTLFYSPCRDDHPSERGLKV